MGCGYSKEFNTVFNSPQFVAWNQSFQALCISKREVSKLFKLFQKADMDGGGTIDVVELLTVIDVERTPFTERVFSIFDDDKSGKIDFYEFVLALWNYCTLSKATLGMFAFDLYDRDTSGVLEEKDVDMMMRDIYGKEANTSHYARQVKRDFGEFMAEGGEITLNRFLEFAKHHHSLLFPAFQMQLYLKKNLLGVIFWEKCADRRIKLSKKKFVTVKQLIEMHALASVEHMQHVKVNTTSGKLAIHSIGHHAHRRKKYSSGSQDPDDPESTDNNERAVYPAETFGEVLDSYPRESAKLKSKIKPSNENNTQSDDLLDSILQKSNNQPYNTGLNASAPSLSSKSGKGTPSFAATASVVAGSVSSKRRASVSAQIPNGSTESTKVTAPTASGGVTSPSTKSADIYSLGPINEYNPYNYSSKNAPNAGAGGSNGSVTGSARTKDRRKSL